MITGGLTFNDQQFFFSVVLICFDIVLTIKIIKHQMGSSDGDQRSTNIIIGCCDFRFLLTNILGPNHHLYVFFDFNHETFGDIVYKSW